MVPPLVQGMVEFNYAHQHGPIAVPQHVHHFCQLDVILGGSMTLRTRGERVVLKPGDGTLIPPVCPHGYDIAGSVRHATFKLHVHPRYTAQLGQRVRLVRFGKEHLTIAEAAKSWSLSAEILSTQGATAVATLCLVHILDDAQASATDEEAAPSSSSHEFWNILSDVIARPHNDWTVRQLADRCHVSEGHFTKTFVRSFGQTPQRFLLETRIWDAADRLSRDDASIKSVAQSTGYATVHSFSRAFKRAMGVSPAAYIRLQGKL